jgi:hypothetical protein
MATNVRSRTASLRRVIPSNVKIPKTPDGMVRRLVLNCCIMSEDPRVAVKGCVLAYCAEAKFSKGEG